MVPITRSATAFARDARTGVSTGVSTVSVPSAARRRKSLPETRSRSRMGCVGRRRQGVASTTCLPVWPRLTHVLARAKLRPYTTVIGWYVAGYRRQLADRKGAESVRAESGVESAQRPTALVRVAVEALDALFFEPLSVSVLLRDAWDGAVGALTRAGVSALPRSPDFPADASRAYALHEQTFPALEAQAAGTIGPDALAEAALEELLARRRDGHTFLHPRQRATFPRVPDPASPAGWSIRTFGIVFTDGPPLAVAAVAPGEPAQRAGVRRGRSVVAINDHPAAHLRRFRADALFDYGDDAVNTLSVRAPTGQVLEVELQPDRLPMPATEILPGPFGYLRLDGFSGSEAEAHALRATFTAFEHTGALGWIVDMRWNRGGGSVHLSRLFVNEGRLFSRLRHNESRLPDGAPLPAREDIDFDGTALPFQRPLAVLVGPGSVSGAESFAGPLQAHGRATLVGERTAGLCGAAPSITLVPGWTITLAARQTVFGPEGWALNRIGVTPDVAVSPTPDDEAAGRDPQLAAAADVLRAATSRS